MDRSGEESGAERLGVRHESTGSRAEEGRPPVSAWARTATAPSSSSCSTTRRSPWPCADLDGRFQEVNPALSTLVLRPVSELGHMALADLTHPDDVAADTARREELVAGRRSSYRHAIRLVRADGVLIWGDVSVCAVRVEYASPRRLIVQIADVTAARARHEESTTPHPASVLAPTADALAALPGRDTLLSLLGHALRIPAALGTLAVLHIDIDVEGREQAEELLVPAVGAHVLDVLAERIVQTVGRSGVVGHMGGGGVRRPHRRGRLDRGGRGPGRGAPPGPGP